MVLIMKLFIALTMTFILLVGCSKATSKIEYIRANPLSAEERNVMISKANPAGEATLIGEFETDDISELSSEDSEIIFYWLRKEVIRRGGNHAVLDKKEGFNYKGRIFKVVR